MLTFSKAPDSAELRQKFGKNLEVHKIAKIQEFVDSIGLECGAAIKAELCRSAGLWFLEHENPQKACKFLSQSVNLYKDLGSDQDGLHKYFEVQALLALAWVRNYEKIEKAENVLMDVTFEYSDYYEETTPLEVTDDRNGY